IRTTQRKRTSEILSEPFALQTGSTSSTEFPLSTPNCMTYGSTPMKWKIFPVFSNMREQKLNWPRGYMPCRTAKLRHVVRLRTPRRHDFSRERYRECHFTGLERQRLQASNQG